MNLLLLWGVLFPFLSGSVLSLLSKRISLRQLNAYLTATLLAVVIPAFILVFGEKTPSFEFNFFGSLSFYLKADSLSKFFLALISIVSASIMVYSFRYFESTSQKIRFSISFLFTMGTCIALSLAGNFFTFYLFYEALTFFSFLLVTYEQTPDSIKAGRKYLAYSIFGSAFVLIGLVVLSYYGNTAIFTPGGVLQGLLTKSNQPLLLIVYFTTFIGFGCKAGMWPMQSWLPAAHPVAPSPASALLSGIVTKAGVLAIIRLTFYLYNPRILSGSWVQPTLIGMTLFTILLGSVLALKEKVFKKRLAYSTVGQVSYILFGLLTLTPAGILGALLHTAFHALIKTTLFLSSGLMIKVTGKTSVDSFSGIGKQMPVTTACFSIASFALIGIPPTVGALSKWFLAEGSLNFTVPLLGFIGVAILILSAIFTAAYLLPFIYKAYLPPRNDETALIKIANPGLAIHIVFILLTALTVLPGIFSSPLIELCNNITLKWF